MNKKLIIIAVLLIYTLIIFLPPIVHGYIYPNNSDDTAFHLLYFEKLRDGESGATNYLGQAIVGYPLIWINDWSGISLNAIFMWFNFIILWLVGISVYWLLKLAVDWKAGLIGTFIIIFGIPATLNMYDAGVIYDLATVGIILPWFLFFMVKFASCKKLLWLIPSVLILAFSIPFHSMVLSQIFGAKVVNPSPTVYEFSNYLVGYKVTLLLLISLFAVIYKRKLLVFDDKVKMMLLGLGIVAILLAILSFTNITSYAYRFSLNLALVLALLTACLIGILFRDINKKKIGLALSACMLLVSVPLIVTYCGYNSAIKPIDKEVIEYVNSIEGDYFSCSTQVAPWIYERFIDKEYKVGELPYIYRNQPMTYKTTEGIEWFWETAQYQIPNEQPTFNEETVAFNDNGLEVKIAVEY